MKYKWVSHLGYCSTNYDIMECVLIKIRSDSESLREEYLRGTSLGDLEF